MKNVTILLAVVAVMAMAVPAQAADYTWGNTGTGEWNAANWGGTAPTADDYCTMDNGGTCTISTGTDAACYALYLGNGAGNGGIVNMTGGTFLSNGESIFDYNGGTGKTYEFNQSGGDAKFGDGTYTPTLYLGYGWGAGGTYSISGGTMKFHEAGFFYLGLDGYGPGTLKVTGGNSTIDLEGTEVTFYDTLATLHMIVNASGISTVADAGAATLNGTLIVEDDGAAAGTYTLMTYASHTGTFAVTKPGNGLWNDPVYDGTSLTITKVPEPMTMALLGIGGIGVLIRRRRK